MTKSHALTNSYHDTSNFIRELCLSLAHRWEPERIFVILTAYLDESGTHNGSPVTIMAAVVGTANQWRNFQKSFSKVKKRFGFTQFHATDFKGKRKEFSGWDNEKCLDLIFELSKIIDDKMMFSLVFSINNEEYENFYKNGEKPKRLQLDTKYGLAFRFSLAYISSELFKRYGKDKRFQKMKLSLVVENGHKNSGSLLAIFKEESELLKSYGLSLLQTLTFADKDCDPLMIADFLSHTSYMHAERDMNNDSPSVFERTNQNQDVIHISFDAEGLSNYRRSIVENWKTRKAISQGAAASASSG